MKDRLRKKLSPWHYTLIGQTPVPETDVLVWARWFEHADRRVKQNRLAGGVKVSTVFLGIDHNWLFDGQPLLFETMVFTKTNGGEVYARVATWAEAEAAHKRAVTEQRAIYEQSIEKTRARS
jgi:hypothetical protein